jgi:hypothetical protein
MAFVGDRVHGTGVILELQRCSRTRRKVEIVARERDAKSGRVCMTWHSLGFFSTLNDEASTELDAGSMEGANDHEMGVV